MAEPGELSGRPHAGPTPAPGPPAGFRLPVSASLLRPSGGTHRWPRLAHMRRRAAAEATAEVKKQRGAQTLGP